MAYFGPGMRSLIAASTKLLCLAMSHQRKKKKKVKSVEFLPFFIFDNSLTRHFLEFVDQPTANVLESCR